MELPWQNLRVQKNAQCKQVYIVFIVRYTDVSLYDEIKDHTIAYMNLYCLLSWLSSLLFLRVSLLSLFFVFFCFCFCFCFFICSVSSSLSAFPRQRPMFTFRVAISLPITLWLPSGRSMWLARFVQPCHMS